MKRTRLFVAALLAALVAICLAIPASSFAATSEPIDVGGDAKACPTTWHYTYGNKYFYSGKSKKKITGSKAICIDVSVWNGDITWKKVKASGVKYAIIRCGYGQDIASQDDTKWLRNVKYAKKNGIKIGVYLYSYANNEVKALSEAKHVLRCLEEAGLTPEDVDLPIYYDMEEESSRPSNRMLARMATVFCNAIAAEGYKVGVYAGAYWYMSYLTDPIFNATGMSKWVANYNSQCTYCRKADTTMDTMANYGNYLDIWQFTSRGYADGLASGISRVDTNLMFTEDFETLEEPLKIPGNQICYDLNGGTNSSKNPSKFSSKTQTVTLSNPTRKGYTFKGWYANGKKVTKISAEDYPAVTLVAKWTANTFNITYELNGGKNNANNVTSRKVASGAFTLSDPTRTGYTFKGWYTSADFAEESKVTEVLGKSKETVTVYAKWSATTYKITYKWNEGIAPESYKTSYKITTKTLSLPVPTREGYGFAGWCAKSDLSDTPIMTVVKGSHGKKTLYAKWVKGAYNAKVVVDELEYHKSASDTSTVKGKLAQGDVVCISSTSKDGLWVKAYGKGWVKLKSVEALS